MTIDRINLLPPEIIAKRRSKKNYAIAGLGGVALIAMVGVLYLFMAAQVTVERQRLENLQSEAARLKSVTAAFNKYKKEEQDLEKVEQLISTVKTQVVNWSDILDHVGFIIPEEVQLDSFEGNSEVKPATVTLSGRSTSFEGVASFIVHLQNSDKIKEVQLKTTEIDPKTNQITFSVMVSLVGPDATAPGQSKPAGG